MRRTYPTAMAVFLLFLALIGCGGNGPVASRPTTSTSSSATDLTRDPPPNFGMHRLAGSGSLGANSCIIVHGLFDTYPEMTILAERLYYQFNYRNVYAMGYNWRIGTATAARYLADQLDNLRSVGKQVTLVGHSRGCLIIRYAIEKLEKTECVKQCFLIAGPHQGSSYATSAQQLITILSQILGPEYGPNIDLSVDYPAIQELVLGNPFLAELNRPNYNQRPIVDYYLFACGRDYIVSRPSAQATSVALEGAVGGAVSRFLIPEATHGSIRRNNADFQKMVSQIRSASTVRASIEINIIPQWTYGWTILYMLANNTTAPMVVKTITFDSYDKYGNWLKCCWYRFGPDSFPEYHCNCNFALPARSELYFLVYAPGDLYYNTTPISELSEHLRTRTMLITAACEQNGVRNDVRVAGLLRYQGVGPSAPPKTRGKIAEALTGPLSGLTLVQPVEIRPITD